MLTPINLQSPPQYTCVMISPDNGRRYTYPEVTAVAKMMRGPLRDAFGLNLRVKDIIATSFGIIITDNTLPKKEKDVAACFLHFNDFPSNHFLIHKVGVRFQHQRSGVGRLLMQAAQLAAEQLVASNNVIQCKMAYNPSATPGIYRLIACIDSDYSSNDDNAEGNGAFYRKVGYERCEDNFGDRMIAFAKPISYAVSDRVVGFDEYVDTCLSIW